MFDRLINYLVNIFNWHDRKTSPSLEPSRDNITATSCDGINQFQTLAFGTPAKVEAYAFNAITSTRGLRFILGTGCVSPVIMPLAILRTVKMIVEKAEIWVH